MRIIKLLFKLSLVAIVGGALAALTSLVKRSSGRPVSFDQWPEVPRKPTSITE